jgi:ATP-binding cassette subfamily B (MDR/TAP) protein 1
MEDKFQEKESTPTKAAKVETKPPIIGYFSLYRYASTKDRLLFVLGIVLSAIHGIQMPLFCLLFGQATGEFTPDKSSAEIKRLVTTTALYMLLLAAISLCSAGSAAFIFGYLSTKVSTAVKIKYFSSILHQDIAWFDQENPEKMTTAFVENSQKLKNVLGRINHSLIFAIGMMAAGLTIGFVYGWWFALIVLLTVPVSMIGLMVFITSLGTKEEKVKGAYESAAGLSEQALMSIRTVKTLVGEEHELSNYSLAMQEAKKTTIKYGYLAGVYFGIFMMSMLFSYGFNFYIGSILMEKQVTNTNQGRSYSVTDIGTIFFAVITGGMNMGQITPSLQSLAVGREAATQIYKIIERVSRIKIDDPEGIKPARIEGDIRFEGVHFHYATKSDTPVLRGMDFEIKKGEKVAFVGETGSGKSTTIQLLERFYDPVAGRVTVDGRDLKEYNLAALRKFMGYVGQEPVLFAMTIKENLLVAKPDATESELYDALKRANAYDFVIKLENKLDTFVGASGSQLSGGQKQRISIARSILQNPTILLLDEATSALDRRNEREIQETLDRFSESRTTVVIAHRLTTVMNSDKIFVVRKGEIVERGTHEHLLGLKGVYANLVSHQLSEEAVRDDKIINLNEVEPRFNGMTQADEDKPQEEVVAPQGKKKPSDEEKKQAAKEQARITKESKKMMNKYLTKDNNWVLLVLGCIGGLSNGVLNACFGLFLGNMIEALGQFQVLIVGNPGNLPLNWEDARWNAAWAAICFIIIAVAIFIGNIMQLGFLSALAIKVSTDLRSLIFKKFLSNKMAFFDRKANSASNLTSVISKDCIQVNTTISQVYGALCMGFGSYSAGMIIAFIASWRLALVSMAVTPLIMFAGYIEMKSVGSVSKQEGSEETSDNNIFQEAATNMRTVNSLNSQTNMQASFDRACERKDPVKLCKNATDGLLFGLGHSGLFIVYGVTFVVGAIFTQDYGLSYGDFFRAMFGSLFGAYGVGMSQQFLPDLAEAQKSAEKIYTFLDANMKENESEIMGVGLKTEIKGEIEFRDVYFTYPERSNPIFKGLSFKVKPKQKVAFAGSSGTGKSTIFMLLYRFYEPSSGQILVDGRDIKEYELGHLRSQLGLVSQEPVLFNETIRENIRYNRREMGQEEIVKAATIANAIGFITNDEIDSVGK